MNIQLAKLKKATVIATDINDYRMQKAKEFGANKVISATKKLDIKADRIVMCTGAMAAFEQAFECIDKKGIILFFAIPDKNITIPTTDFWRNELTITSSYGAAHVDLEESLELIKNKKVDVKSLITHRYKLDKIQEAFKLAGVAGESLKVVILS